MEEVNVPEDTMFQWAERGLKVQLHDSANSPVSLNTMTDSQRDNENVIINSPY